MNQQKPTRQWILFLFCVVPGGIGVLVFGRYALKDWAALQTTYWHFEQLAQRSNDMSSLFVAEAMQNIHRINLFAEGVWTLLSAILAAIGILGICLLRKANQDEEQESLPTP